MNSEKEDIDQEVKGDEQTTRTLSKFRPVGRPPKWETPEELTELINQYFSETHNVEWTVTGLAISIGCSRTTLFNYAKKNDDFAKIINEAKDLVENSYERSLRRRGQTGDIFALKNFGWIDRVDNNNLNANVDVDDDKVRDKVSSMFDD